MPSGLVSAPPIAHHAIQQDLALQYPATLLQRPPARLHTLRIKHIYTALVAADFAMPRVLNSERGAAARHLSLFSSVDPPFRVAAIGRAVRRIKHAAVPPELTETAHSVALSTPEKKQQDDKAGKTCEKNREARRSARRANLAHGKGGRARRFSIPVRDPIV